MHLSAVAFTAEKLLLPQLSYLRARGYRVGLACAPDSGGYPKQLQDFSPIDIRFPRSLRPGSLVRATARLVHALRQTKPDILHVHTPAAAIPVRMLPRFLLPRGMKIVYTVHGYAHVWSGTPKDRILERLERMLTPRADLVLFQSQEDLNEAQQRRYKGKLRFLGNGVEEPWFEVPPPHRRGPLRLMFVGRLVAEKGVLELLEAADDCEGTELTIVGAQLDSDRDGVQDQVETWVSKRQRSARYLGMLSQEELIEQIANVDVVVLPSYREGVPRSVIEGMAAGRIAIGTRIRGCRELITDGANGILVDSGDSAQLRTAIETIRDLSTGAFAQWSELARRTTERNHRESQVFERLDSAYREVIETR